MKPGSAVQVVCAVGCLFAIPSLASAQRTITADVVALDQAFYNNRIGAFQAGGMIFALRRDVVNNTDPQSPDLTAGHVMLRPDKRPRPIVLRMNVGDCLQVNFENLLADIPSMATGGNPPFNPQNLRTVPDPNSATSSVSQSATRLAGIHVMGMELKQAIGDDGGWNGANPNSLAAPGE
jgi:manganese oxidase